MKRYILPAIVAGSVILPSQSHAQSARQEYIPFPSADMTTAEFLTGNKGKPIMLAGQLQLPKLGEKLPAVILLHGAGGVGGTNGAYGAWVPILNEAGIATFAVDSFTGRGAVNLPADAFKISSMARTVDAFGALEVLAKNPAIDATRIAVMGFSHGSSAAIDTNLQRFQKIYGAAQVSFAAHIAVYSICNTTYHEDEVATKPLLMLHGAADDWLPADRCREYVDRLAKAGKTARFIEYAGAYHAYDVPEDNPERKLPKVTTSRNCKLAEGDNGQIINVSTQKPFTRTDACVEAGVTIAYQEAAAKKSHEDVKAFLREVFKLK